MRKRSGRPSAGPGAIAKPAFAAAAAIADSTMSPRAGTRSTRFVSAETSAPVTKPSCTAIVSHEP